MLSLYNHHRSIPTLQEDDIQNVIYKKCFFYFLHFLVFAPLFYLLFILFFILYLAALVSLMDLEAPNSCPLV